MLKNILKLDGAQQLSKNEQKEISGGRPIICMINGVCTRYSSACMESACKAEVIICPICPDGPNPVYQGTREQCAMGCNM